MFDVLVYLYEHYWTPDACPEPKLLSRKLSAAGFEREEIQEALRWLEGLAPAEAGGLAQQPGSERHYTAAEQEALGEEGLGFVRFLEGAGVLPPAMRESVVDRALATGMVPMDLEDLKVIVLMVFWSAGEEPDALILDELFVDPDDRALH